MNIATKLSTTAIIADPGILFREPHGVYISDINTAYVSANIYLLTPTPSNALLSELFAEEIDEAEDMVSLRADITGVDNTVFVSTKGYGRHAARIKIAIDPPNTFNAASKTASMALYDCNVRGEYAPPKVLEQAKNFIERNRDVLLDYWENKIDTHTMIGRLRPPGSLVSPNRR